MAMLAEDGLRIVDTVTHCTDADDLSPRRAPTACPRPDAR
jgi:hypothetical protein